MKSLDRLAEELAKVPKAKGTRGTLRGKPKGVGPSGGARKAPPDKSAPTRAELGTGKKEAARSEKIAGLPPDERKALVEELKAEGKAITPNGVLAKKRAGDKAAAIFSDRRQARRGTRKSSKGEGDEGKFSRRFQQGPAENKA